MKTNVQKQSQPGNKKLSTAYKLIIAALVFVVISAILNFLPLQLVGSSYEMIWVVLCGPILFAAIYLILIIIASAFILKSNPDHKMRLITILIIIAACAGFGASTTELIIMMVLINNGNITPNVVSIVPYLYVLGVFDLIVLALLVTQFIFLNRVLHKDHSHK
ncbi:MAG: hypothetical protein LBS76_00535 [Mycoplasmataceae bacterium]|jgi:hypothetical protein|nr:hypothetical protein [Mycoplasmataceae bacterium]